MANSGYMLSINEIGPVKIIVKLLFSLRVWILHINILRMSPGIKYLFRNDNQAE